MFRSPLVVEHIDSKDWKLTGPLLWEGRWEYIVIKSGFVTDFASIPRPVRWLLDNAGRNSEAAVLHDAVWRDSKRESGRQVDPWHADGMFRRALRETGSTALARGSMWLAVRAAAMLQGYVGQRGPSIAVKVLQLVGLAILGLIAIGPTTVIAVIGLIGYWIISWIVAVGWYLLYERRHADDPPNWPWPLSATKSTHFSPYEPDLLIVLSKPDGQADDDPRAVKIKELIESGDGSVTGSAVEAVLA